MWRRKCGFYLYGMWSTKGKKDVDMKGLRVWYKSPQVRAVCVYGVCVVH